VRPAPAPTGRTDVARPYRLEYVGADRLDAELPDDALGAVRFGARPSPPRAHRIDVPLEVLHGDSFGEIWHSTLPVRRFTEDGISWTENDELLFIQHAIPESALANLEDAVCDAYTRLNGILERRGYRHWLRAWNFLSDINSGDGDAERYRRFSAGRFQALARRTDFERALPAASTIGTPCGSGLHIYIIAATRPGLQVENPLQVSAFKYPRLYGRRSPSFSRALMMGWQDHTELFVSGTASIVGHESHHPGDPLAQLRRTADNLTALRHHAQEQAPDAGALQPTSLKLYLRRRADLPLILPLLPELFGDVPAHVLAGDICRRELLLEVELMYSAGGRS
jgi:chorismate lyase/3-hydroxybenzoate synthase